MYEEEEFRSVFKKKENLGVCAKQKVRQNLQVNSKYSLESSRRDLHNALLCTVLMESRLVEEMYAAEFFVARF